MHELEKYMPYCENLFWGIALQSSGQEEVFYDK